MVLHELDCGVEVRLVELVGDVPAERAELASLLQDCVHEGDGVEKWTPLGGVRHFQEVGAQALEGPLQAGANPLRRLGRELDRHLQQADRELASRLRCDPHTEALVHTFGCIERVQHLVAEVQRQVAVLQQHPATRSHRTGYQAPGVDLLALAHADRSHFHALPLAARLYGRTRVRTH